jgi:hypothetical protein
MEPLSENYPEGSHIKKMAVFSNRPFRFEKGFAPFASLRFKKNNQVKSHIK